MKLVIGLIVLLLISYINCIVYDVEHSFDNGKSFSKRGELEVKLTKKSLSVKGLNEDALGQADIDGLKQLTEGSNGMGFYLLRIKLSENNYVLTNIRICSLISSKFKEVVKLHVDKSGKIIGLQYSLPTSSKECPLGFNKNILNNVKKVKILSKYVASLPSVPDAVPDNFVPPNMDPKASGGMMGMMSGINSQSNQENKNNDASGKDGEENKPPESFLRKYWYIFLPLMLMSVLGQPPPPAEGGEGGNAASAAAAAGSKRKKK